MQKLLLTSVCYLCMLTLLSAQEKLNSKFGKIQPQDFEINSSLLDSNVNAIVLSDQGSTEFEGNSKGWFAMTYRRHKRIKLINKNGFDAADISIFLYSDGQNAEKLSELKANTYNLQNGEVVTTELGKKSIFTEKINRNLIQYKFTFPALTSGSIIEFTYTIESDFMFNLQPWIFQGDYPCLWSEYSVKIPDFFSYVFLSQGYLKFDIEEKAESFKRFMKMPARNLIKLVSIIDSLCLMLIIRHFVWNVCFTFIYKKTYTTVPSGSKISVKWVLLVTVWAQPVEFFFFLCGC